MCDQPSTHTLRMPRLRSPFRQPLTHCSMSAFPVPVCPSVRLLLPAVNEDMVAGLVEEAHGDAHLAVLNVVQT